MVKIVNNLIIVLGFFSFYKRNKVILGSSSISFYLEIFKLLYNKGNTTLFKIYLVYLK